ncbi:alpha/beta-hydrolase [Macrolepiota fuliginosa MF-IS2]|uniref:Alpha/beta-hydrolase n=1 Tax=Macrolepiota fuliginosa MF-IS2 TaxID=1400762 RepID=A0A9P5XAL1_9AGAR|nr:alpha/beta-hydrolase [Macrolepiota fuliginosa MF-IS2]
MASLPSFLTPLPNRPNKGAYLNAVYHHPAPLGPAHCIYWPPKKPDVPPETVVIFIPGNPGLLDFYTPFLNALYEKDATENLAIIAQTHIDHTPGVYKDTNPHSRHSLTSQVHSAIEAFDATVAEFRTSKVVVIGHSVGAWITLQVLKERPNLISGIFLLFPTIAHIADTPNAKKLSNFFKPVPRRFIARFSHVGRHMPVWLLHRIVGMEWPISQVKVIRELTKSPSSIRATLRMGHEEMLQIREPDVALLHEHRDRLWFYFAEHDDWVGKQKEYIINKLKPEAGSLRITYGDPKIPHAFSLNYGEEVAQQCHQWLLQMNLTTTR